MMTNYSFKKILIKCKNDIILIKTKNVYQLKANILKETKLMKKNLKLQSKLMKSLNNNITQLKVVIITLILEKNWANVLIILNI